jgi:hypothetical protein
MTASACGHYTSQRGLIGILSTETLWATNIKFLNDEQEFQHAVELIKQIIPTSKITSAHPHHAVHVGFLDRIKAKLELLHEYETGSIYTCSFSQEVDLLSQWRGYCPENNGFCLVFALDEVFKSVQTTYPTVELKECIYEDADKEARIKALLNKHWPLYHSAADENAKQGVIDKLGKEVMLMASYFKHSSFSEEKERRLVLTLDYPPISGLKFRNGRFSLIPYIELQVPRSCVKSVCIGPTAHKTLAQRALEMFLEMAYGGPFDVPAVGFSKTPYRPW